MRERSLDLISAVLRAKGGCYRSGPINMGYMGVGLGQIGRKGGAEVS